MISIISLLEKRKYRKFEKVKKPNLRDQQRILRCIRCLNVEDLAIGQKTKRERGRDGLGVAVDVLVDALNQFETDPC